MTCNWRHLLTLRYPVRVVRDDLVHRAWRSSTLQSTWEFKCFSKYIQEELVCTQEGFNTYVLIYAYTHTHARVQMMQMMYTVHRMPGIELPKFVSERVTSFKNGDSEDIAERCLPLRYVLQTYPWARRTISHQHLIIRVARVQACSRLDRVTYKYIHMGYIYIYMYTYV